MLWEVLIYVCEACVNSIFYQLAPDTTIDCQKLCSQIQRLILENIKDCPESKILKIHIGPVTEIHNKLYLENKND